MEMVASFIEKVRTLLRNIMVEANWWNVIKSKRNVKCAMLVTINHILAKYVGFYKMASSKRKGCANSLQIEILETSMLLKWEGKQLNLQFNQMTILGLLTIKDAMLV